MAHLLVDLDSLLDTRIATLIYIDEEQASKAFDLGYKDRLSDRWSELGLDIDQQHYEKIYAQRAQGDFALKRARLSNAAALVTHMSMELEKQAISTPFNDYTKITINTYPYLFSDEVQRLFLEGIRLNFPSSVRLEMDRIPIEELTPRKIRENYDLVMLYDLDEFLNAQIENFKEVKIPSVILIAPALYGVHTPKEEELYDDEGNYLDPFSTFEYIMTEFISLNLAKPRYFSLIDL